MAQFPLPPYHVAPSKACRATPPPPPPPHLPTPTMPPQSSLYTVPRSPHSPTADPARSGDVKGSGRLSLCTLWSARPSFGLSVWRVEDGLKPGCHPGIDDRGLRIQIPSVPYVSFLCLWHLCTGQDDFDIAGQVLGYLLFLAVGMSATQQRALTHVSVLHVKKHLIKGRSHFFVLCVKESRRRKPQYAQ